MQKGSDDDADYIRQHLVEGYADKLVPFLLPAVRARAMETEREEFVPTHSGIVWVMAHPGFRVIAAFDHGKNAQAQVRAEILESELVDDVWHLPGGEEKTVQKVFDDMCVSIAHAIGVAWTEAILYDVERVTGDEGRQILCVSDIGDDMLPKAGQVFHAVIAYGEIHLATALAVLRKSRAQLAEGEFLPSALARDFIGFD